MSESNGCGGREQFREQLQTLFDNAFETNDCEALRRRYRELRSMEFSCGFDFEEEAVDISSLAQSVTAACDILTASTGAGFVYCGNDTRAAAGSGRLITKALLNLLSNAYLYGSESLITVKTVETKEYIRLEVLNGGSYGGGCGRGLGYVRRVCESHGGKFFTESTLFTSRAIMALPKKRDFSKTAACADCFNLLNDRLSPLYVEFFGMEYH